MIHVGSPLLISAWFIQPLLLHSATTEVIHCALPCFPLIRTGAPSSAGTGTDYVSSCFCSVSVYVSRNCNLRTTVLFCTWILWFCLLTFYVMLMLLIATLYQLQSTSKIIFDIYLRNLLTLPMKLCLWEPYSTYVPPGKLSKGGLILP